MPNNSKLLPQVRPSTLDIVFKNSPMNLETAIGRLEQAVTKAYGNINSSINSKQGEFNQALLKTLDQSISKSSDKMDLFFTSSFAKIYAFNSAIMEQSLKKNGMVAAQKDLDTFKNYDKLFENQQKAFGDINLSLQQIIEKIDRPSTSKEDDYSKKQMIKNGDFINTRNMKYHELSTFLQTTDLHEVSRTEALANADNVNKNLFQKRNIKEFTENPLIKTLTANDEGALKELQGATDFGKFWMILIEKLSKAKDENNKEVMQEVQKFFKTDAMVATATDPRITPSKEGKKSKDNLPDRIQKRSLREEQSYNEVNKRKLILTDIEGKQVDYVTKLFEIVAKLTRENEKKHKKVLDDYNDRNFAYGVGDQTYNTTLDKQKGAIRNSAPANAIQSVANTVPDVDVDLKFIKGKVSVGAIMSNIIDFADYGVNHINAASHSLQARVSAQQTLSNKQKRDVGNEENQIGSRTQSTLVSKNLSDYIHQKMIPTPKPERSVVIKRNDAFPMLTSNNYNTNSQLIKQILSTPRTMHQKFDLSFIFNQNASGKIQHSFESSTPISPRGDSPVIRHRSYQTDIGAR